MDNQKVKTVPDVVSEEMAKKLSRYKLPQGQSRHYYQKRNHCSVYDLKDSEERKNSGFCTYDAPTFDELRAFAYKKGWSLLLFGDENTEAMAEKIIGAIKSNKSKKQ